MEIYWDDINDQTVKSNISVPPPGSIYHHTYPEFFSPATKDFRIRVVVYSGDSCFHTSFASVTIKATPEILSSPLPGICANKPAFQLIRTIGNNLSGSGVFSGEGISSSGNFNPQSAGPGIQNIRYTFTASNGCVSFSDEQVTVFPVPTVNAGPDRYVLEGGNAVLLASANGNGLNYLWDPAAHLNLNNILQPTTTPADDITYTLKVMSSDGCVAEDNVFIKVLKTPGIPNTFSPNGDGIHDRWEIKYLESYPGATVEIYNRYGQMIFQSTGYSKPWDGTFRGSPLPAGTYYYIINPKNGRKQMAGFVDIIR
jgi:gliding motility-associated-like protein